MGNVVIVGAGKEGKGYAGDVYEAAGWHMTFLDKDPAVINALKDNGGYTLTNLRVDRTETRKITEFDAFTCDDAYSVTPAVIEADLITLCIYPEDIAEAAAYLAPCFKERIKQNPDKKLTILCMTNKNHYMHEVEASFLQPLGNDAQWFNDNVALRDCIVRRGSNAASTVATDVTAETSMSLLIQPPINCDLSQVEWMELRDGIEELKDVKIYTYNSPHATGAYAGYLIGLKTIKECSEHPVVGKLMADVKEECIQGILRSGKYSITEEELRAFTTMPVLKDSAPELVSRVAINPIRKLARYDRLMGPAMLCYESGFDPANIVLSVANGMAYDEPTDPDAQKMQGWVRDMGIEKATSKVVGLPEEHELVQRIANAYRNIER